MSERITQYETDNRDVNTTWLTLPDGTVVEVDPIELFRNAMENVSEGVGLMASLSIKNLLEEVDRTIDEAMDS